MAEGPAPWMLPPGVISNQQAVPEAGPDLQRRRAAHQDSERKRATRCQSSDDLIQGVSRAADDRQSHTLTV